MNYVNFEVGNHNYKLRLNTRNIIDLEKKLGCNPLAVFGLGEVNTLPTITVLITIFHASLQQYNHGITLNDAYDIFDEWINEGNSTTDFYGVVLDVYKISGLIPKGIDTVEEASVIEKN